MPHADRNALRFVRALLAGRAAERREGEYVVADVPSARLPAREVTTLAAAGVLDISGDKCRAARDARTWMKRALIEADQFVAQHRDIEHRADGTMVNLSESPLGRLARPARGEKEAFLTPAQVEAGERVRRLADRARLQPRLTMSYSATHTVNGANAGGGAGDISDLAADARRQLTEIIRALPRDCAGVVMDVCGLEKGLQAVEADRGWPRRSAKLVLRVGLDQLARHFGLDEAAQGPERGRQRRWMAPGGQPRVVD